MTQLVKLILLMSCFTSGLELGRSDYLILRIIGYILLVISFEREMESAVQLIRSVGQQPPSVEDSQGDSMDVFTLDRGDDSND